MYIIDNYIATLKNYVGFDGTATRREFWWYTLANFIVTFIIAFIAGLFNVTWPITLYSLAVFLPSLAISIRRLRDGSHWAWIFINLLPGIGSIVYLIMLCLPSKDSA